MKSLLTILSLFAVTLCFAQKSKTQQVLYFKNNGQKVPTVDSADYIRAINLPDSGSTLFGIVDYYRNGKPKLMGKSSTIDPAVFEEQCVTFYSNGKRESVFSYSGGMITGTGYLFYPNGKMHASLDYDTAATKTLEDRVRITTCLDTTGKALVTDGNGRYIDYNIATGAISEEGPVKNGKPDGEWHGSYPSEKVTYTDTYRDGKFVSGYCVTATGTRYTYTSRQQSPQFKGGEAAFVALIKKKFKYPTTLKNKSAMGVMSFAVDKNGKVSQARFLGNITPEINKIITAAINASPNWTPAIQNGLPVNSSWIVSTTFGTVAPVKKGK
jgi:antitoxin component YwqK of YwqJK toxin-antitoxin module